jgi:zinc transport system ATP-binding protein
MTQMPLLSANALSVTLGGRAVLQNVNLALRLGEIVSIIGPNGAGKTTLLRTLLGLQAPSSGSVTRANNLRIGYVPQRLPIDPLLPLNVRGFLQLWGSGQEQRVRDLLDRPLQKLSGGEFQRVLLARALIGQPQLLVLDEPAQALDLAGQQELYAELVQLRASTGCAVLLVSHDLTVVMRQTDRVLCLHGHICCEGKPADVSRDPAYVALFGDQAAAFGVYHHQHDHAHHVHVHGEHCKHG